MKTPHCLGRMDDKGVTLIELLVVVGIIVILAVALGFSYQGWMGRYKIEKATKELYTDLMNTRSLALTRNRMYFVDFPTSTSYRVIEDTNDNNASNVGAGDNVLLPFPKTVEYAITWTGGTISFDKRGIINVGGTISFTSPAGVDPDYDCIRISQTRINMGLMSGVTCNAK